MCLFHRTESVKRSCSQFRGCRRNGKNNTQTTGKAIQLLLHGIRFVTKHLGLLEHRAIQRVQINQCQICHLCPGLHAAVKFASFRVLAKNCKNRKVDDFSLSLAIFRSSVIRNDYPVRNRSISRSGYHGLATALRCFTTTPRQKDLMCFWFRLRKYL